MTRNTARNEDHDPTPNADRRPSSTGAATVRRAGGRFPSRSVGQSAPPLSPRKSRFPPPPAVRRRQTAAGAKIQESKLANGLTVWVLPRTGLPLAFRRPGRSRRHRERSGRHRRDAAAARGRPARRHPVAQRPTDRRAAEGDWRQSRHQRQRRRHLRARGRPQDRDGEDARDSGRCRPAAGFPGGEVDLVKANALQSLQAAKANPEFDVQKVFAEAVFGDHPYRITNPTEAAIEGVTPAFLGAQHGRPVPAGARPAAGDGARSTASRWPPR